MQPIHFCDQPQQVLVTGATGFIGRQLVDALLRDQHTVTVLSRSKEKVARTFKGQVRCIQSMLELPVTEQVDVVINLAGARILGWHWTAARKEVLRRSRIGVTQSIVDWIAKAEQKPRLMLSASAIGYYGTQAQGDDTRLTEKSAPAPIFMSQLCQEWEATARQAEAFGVHVIRMRFGLVLGHQGALPMMLLPIKLGIGGHVGTGRQWLSWIHVHDLIRGMAHLWQLHDQKNDGVQDDVYNFTAPEAVTQKQFTHTASEVLHRPDWLPIPAFLMRLPLGEQADLLLEGQRVAPQKLNNMGFRFVYPDMRSALQDLA